MSGPVRPARPRRPPLPVGVPGADSTDDAVVTRGEDGVIHYHFPVEIEVRSTDKEGVDERRIAEYVFERLARRLSEDP